MADENDERTSALLLNSTTWDRSGTSPRPRNLRIPLGREAIAWQKVAMRTVRQSVPKAVRAEGIAYVVW